MTDDDIMRPRARRRMPMAAVMVIASLGLLTAPSFDAVGGKSPPPPPPRPPEPPYRSLPPMYAERTSPLLAKTSCPDACGVACPHHGKRHAKLAKRAARARAQRGER